MTVSKTIQLSTYPSTKPKKKELSCPITMSISSKAMILKVPSQYQEDSTNSIK